MHQNVNSAEIAQKLKISIDEVNKSEAIKNTYIQIKNDPSISEDEREDMFMEMASIYKSMLAGKH